MLRSFQFVRKPTNSIYAQQHQQFLGPAATQFEKNVFDMQLAKSSNMFGGNGTSVEQKSLFAAWWPKIEALITLDKRLYCMSDKAFFSRQRYPDADPDSVNYEPCPKIPTEEDWGPAPPPLPVETPLLDEHGVAVMDADGAPVMIPPAKDIELYNAHTAWRATKHAMLDNHRRNLTSWYKRIETALEDCMLVITTIRQHCEQGSTAELIVSAHVALMEAEGRPTTSIITTPSSLSVPSSLS